MANDIKVLKNNTLEELRQKTNEISFNQGDNTQLDITRLADKVYDFTATTSNGGKFYGNSLSFHYLPDLSLDNTGGYIILKDGTSIPASFSSGDTLTQSGGFSATLVSSSVVDGKKKLLVKNTTGTFNPAQSLTDGTGTITATNLLRIISEGYNVGSIRVTKDGSVVSQNLEADGFHVPTIAASIPLTGSSTLTDITEGTLAYQGDSQSSAADVEANASWYGTVYHINSSIILLKTYAGNFNAGTLIRFLGLSQTIVGANHGALSTYSSTESHIIELNTPATNNQAIKIITGDVVDSINELQDDIGTVENLATTANDLVTAINEHETDLYTSTTGSFTGLTSKHFKGAIEELRAELGNHNDINNATGYSATTAVTGITEIQGDIGDVTSLTTSHKATLVGAIGEIEAVFDASTKEISAGSNAFNVTSGTFTINSSANINLDTGNNHIVLKDDGVEFGRFTHNAGQLQLKSGANQTFLTASNTNATFNNNLTVENDLDVDNNLNVDGTGVIDSTLSVGGLASLNGGIAVDTNKFTVADGTGNTSIAGTLGVTGATTLTGNLATQGSNTLGNGTGDDTTVSGDLTVNVNTLLSGTVNIDGATDIDSTLDVLNGTTLRSTLDVNGVTNFNNTTQSTSTTTGAVRIDGGLGIAKNTYVGGNLDVTGTLDIGTLTTTAQTVKLAINELQSEIGSAVFTGDITNGAGSVTAAIGLIETEIGDDEAYRSPTITYGATTISGVLVNLNDELDALNSLTLTAGSGLTGGGTLASNRTFSVGQGTGISVTANAVGIANGGVGTTQLATNAVTTVKIADGNVTNAKLDNSTITISAESGTAHAIALGETLTVSAGAGINTNITNNTLTISGELASETNAGIATFDGTDFTVTSGDVTLNDERIEDIVGAMVSGGTEDGISVTYVDADGGAGKLSFDIDDNTVLRLAGTQTVSGNKTFTGSVDLSNATVTFGSGGSVQNFNTQFLTLTADTNISGLRIDRSANTSASHETGIDPDFFWDETQVDTGANNTSHRAWRLKGLSNANSPIANVADVVTFYNAKDLVSSSNSNGITATFTMDTNTAGEHQGIWDFDVNVDNSSIEISSDSLRVKAGGITNAMLAGSIANGKLSNSTISGKSLGSNLSSLTAGTGVTLSGGYNGSTARQISIGQPIGPGDSPTFNNLTVSGNLYVQGDNTILTTSTLSVEDKNITLNYGTGNTNGTADGAGITIQDAQSASPSPIDATFQWKKSTGGGTDDRWELSHILHVGTVVGNLAGDVKNGSSVVLDASTGVLTGSLSGNASSATALSSNRSFTLTGDVTGTVTNNLSSGFSIATNIAANKVGASELKVSTNGTSGQSLVSDGDGTFSWATRDNYQYWTLRADGGSDDNITSAEVVDFQGGNAITTTANASGVDISVDNNSIAVAELDCDDGTAGQVLQTDGNGNLSFGSVSTVNNFVSSATFNTGNGVLTLNRSGLTALTVDLDGRYSTTDTNTTYTAGIGLVLSESNQFKVNLNSETIQTVAANSLSSTSSRTYSVQRDSGGDLVVNVPWVDTNTDTQRAIHDTPVNGATNISISSNWAFDNVKTSVPSNAVFTDTVYSQANSSTLGLVKTGYSENGRNYPVELSNGQMYVNVPWVDTNTNTNTQNQYSTSVVSSSGIKLRLSGSGHNGNTTDDVKFEGSGATTVSRIDASTIRITSTDTNTDTNNYLSGLSWDAGSGVLTASRSGLTNLTVDLDGRYSTTDTNTTDWRVANGTGSQQFAVSAAEQVRFVGSGATTVSFESSPQRITISSTDTNDIDYINSASFNTNNGILTLSGVGNAGATVDLDGRYLQGVALGTTHNASNVVITNDSGSNATINAATTSLAGIMTKDDKIKLNGIATGAEVNQNAFSYVYANTYDSSTQSGINVAVLSADSKLDSFTIETGHGFTTTASSANDKMTINRNNDWRTRYDNDNAYVGNKSKEYVHFDPSGSIRMYADGQQLIEINQDSAPIMDLVFNPNNTDHFKLTHETINQSTAEINLNFVDGTNGTSTDEFRFESDGKFHANGDIIAFSTSTNSDRKLKENIQKVDGALEKVSQLNGVTFDWKKDGTSSAGVIAQNVEEVMPTAVKDINTLNEDDTHKVVDYNQLSALFIEAIKELKEENKSLRDEIQKLINKE